MEYLWFITKCISFLSLSQKKVSRLLKYLQFRDYKSKLLKALEDDDTQQETGSYSLTHTLHLPGDTEKMI